MKKHKLEKAKRYHPNSKSKLVCPVLIPTYGINRVATEEDAERFADKFAREGWGNFMRFFVAGNWEPLWKKGKRVWFRYEYKNRKYDLTQKNQKHFDCLWRRMGYLVERRIYPMITLLDNCSLHWPRPGYWRTHWMNGNNNTSGTHTEAYSQTHWYEYNHPPDERPGMKETGEALMDLYRYVLEEAKVRFGDYFLVEIGNEIDARMDYHIMLKKLIDEIFGGKPKKNYWRVFTSMFWDHFYQVSVNQSCIPVLHGVGTIQDFENRKYLVDHGNRNYMVSQDGCFPLDTISQTKKFVLHVLQSNCKGVEGNLRPIFEWKDGMWKNVGGNEDWTFRSLKYGLLRAFGKAFEAYLGA